MGNRLESVAEKISRGADPQTAMIDSGYGEKFAAGYAGEITGLLVKEGYLKAGAAPKGKRRGDPMASAVAEAEASAGGDA